MSQSSLVNIRLVGIGSLAALALGILAQPARWSAERGVTGAAFAGSLAAGLVAAAVVLAYVGWRATARAGSSLDPATRFLGRAPVFVIAGIILMAMVAAVALSV